MIEPMTGSDLDDETRWFAAEVAAHLGVAPATLYAYRARGQMPEPDGQLGRSPWWRPHTITTWHASRPRPGGQRRPATS